MNLYFFQLQARGEGGPPVLEPRGDPGWAPSPRAGLSGVPNGNPSPSCSPSPGSRRGLGGEAVGWTKLQEKRPLDQAWIGTPALPC